MNFGATVHPWGTSHHCGCCRGTGTHVNPTTFRGAELPSPAAFPRKAHRHSTLGCCAGGGRRTTSKQRLPAVPTFANCRTRKTMQAALPLMCQQRGRGGWRQAQEGQLIAEHKIFCNTVVISIPNNFGMIQFSINILLMTCLHCKNTKTSKPWAELNLVTGGSHGNESAAALISPRANKSDKHLDSKAEFHSPP